MNSKVEDTEAWRMYDLARAKMAAELLVERDENKRLRSQLNVTPLGSVNDLFDEHVIHVAGLNRDSLVYLNQPPLVEKQEPVAWAVISRGRRHKVYFEHSDALAHFEQLSKFATANSPLNILDIQIAPLGNYAPHPCPECEKLKAERDHVQADVSHVYMEVTGGLCSKENTPASVVISLFEDYLSRRVNEEVSDIAKERDELAAQVEKMQEALKLSERCFDLIKDVKGPLDWHLILKSELVIKRALSTPDLSTGILNRVRAEALLMAACVIELYGDATLREEDYRLNSAECGDIIRALAADMGAGKCQVY